MCLEIPLVDDRYNYELFLNSLKTALILVNDKFEVSFANEAALNLLETGINQIRERPLNDFLVDDNFNQQQIIRALNNQEDYRETGVAMCFRDGRCITVDINANIINVNGQTKALLEINPVDKQRKITRESQQYAQQVAARELVRGLAHEIKNPLGGIRGAAQLLEKKLPRQEEKEFTQMIIDQADRLSNLVDRLLGPNSLPQKRQFNLHQILDKVQSVIMNDLSFSMELTRDYDPSIPDLFADPDMLQQAILNIARNASQALQSDSKTTPHQPMITFKTRIERQCVIKGVRHQLCAKVSITDNGPGIPSDLKDTLFYPMVSSKENGSGLGLSIAQTLTDYHNGKIDVQSFPGFTEFSLYIPIFAKDTSSNQQKEKSI
ncbi:MAG: two-component system nitrogen regulation sensor histidine kinase GlnL [Alphaproteobacteria bacterium]|jgi:two-component system nitrogen regulation sensor histidine kinase GlnL